MRAVVVGAGLAGLRAATDLRAAGVDVVLVEAGHRPGGRVRTVRDAFVGGQYAESGAEWVDTHHRRMLELLDRYGVRLLGVGEQWTVIRRWLHHRGRLLSPDELRLADPDLDRQLGEFERIVEDAAAGIADPARPHEHPDATRLDARSLADVAVEAGLGELALLFKRRDAQGEFAAEPSDVSLLFVAQQRAYQQAAVSAGTTVRAHRAEGGFSAVAEGMAGELGDVVAYGEQLLEVIADDDGVALRTNRRQLRADHLVLACSLVPLRSVAFEPALPASFHRALHELDYGTVTKTAVQWPARTWPAGYATTDGVLQRVYEPTIDQPGDRGILMAYCGGVGGHEWARRSEAERVALAAEEMRRMYAIAEAPVGGLSRAWSNEPRYGGSYAVYRPGQVTAFWQVLREPVGRIHLAGEHVATCTGYMEGALESGETVAARIIARG